MWIAREVLSVGLRVSHFFVPDPGVSPQRPPVLYLFPRGLNCRWLGFERPDLSRAEHNSAYFYSLNPIFLLPNFFFSQVVGPDLPRRLPPPETSWRHGESWRFFFFRQSGQNRALLALFPVFCFSKNQDPPPPRPIFPSSFYRFGTLFSSGALS